jgi:hypothetical protein
MRSGDYREKEGSATIDRDLAVLSGALLVGAAALAGERRRELEAMRTPPAGLDVLIEIEERIGVELRRRARRAA